MPEGEDFPDKGPLRRCFVTYRTLPKEQMVRFVVGPDSSVVPDIAEKLPGRGLWLTASRDIVSRAVARRLFGKAAKAAVTVPADLADRVEARLVARCLDLVGMARRAGRSVAGFEKVRSWLGEGRVALIIEASDAGPHGVAKLGRQLGDCPVSRVLTADELGQAFARDRIVHVAISAGRLAKALKTDTDRLAGFRQSGSAGPVDGRPDGGHSGEAGGSEERIK
ncbi:hypothetical protein EDC65_3697 [Stella humosa]|uniref:YlxR domain-containing protein n=1 Tax=Stella humosa TaxID=94 RepID=A0A3N1L1L0_9PROT|nr:RNA-binding protein [Stella humosa]ROP84346.1 hypothetical protein EDC65_3697 [Stella humosa]BBK33861.1 hypothetical protein STHU_44950 [Stella humosa]